MIDDVVEPKEQRLRVLEPKEIKDIFDLPTFSQPDQEYFFSLSVSEQIMVERQKLSKNRVLMILQIGYLKAKQRFFDFNWRDVITDIEHISNQYFRGTKIHLGKSPAYKTKLNQQKQILAELKYQQFTASTRSAIARRASELAQNTVHPAQLFRHLLKVLLADRVVIPSYRTFQDIITAALSNERKRVRSVFKKTLSPGLSDQMVFWLKENRPKETELLGLIQEPKNFKYMSVKKEIENKNLPRPWYSDLAKVVKALAISPENIEYYASLLPFHGLSRLVKLKQQNQFLILICFLYLRYQKINDHLIDALRVTVNGLQQDAKTQAREAFLEYKLNIENQFGQVGQILNLFTDDKIDNSELFGDIRNLAFDCLNEKDLVAVINYINRKSPTSKIFEWEALEKLYSGPKPILRAILRTLYFSYQASDSLAKAVTFFNSVKRISGVKSSEWPIQ